MSAPDFDPEESARFDREDAEREAVDVVEDFAAFMSRVRGLPPARWLVEGLIPEEGITLWHGKPRSMKTLCAETLVLAGASGLSVFGHFAVERPFRSLYITEEDSERETFRRFERLAAGMGANPLPGHLHVRVRKGFSLDSPADRRWLHSTVESLGTQHLVLEPVKSLTAFAEKTAAEFKPVMDQLRLIQSTTACASILLGHHNTKSPRQGVDTRDPSEQASGSALFSASDCLVSFVKEDWNRTLCTPANYKLEGTPKPFSVTFTTEAQTSRLGAPMFGSWVRPVAEMQDERPDERVAVVSNFLKANPWRTADEIGSGCGIDKADVPRLLAQLEAAKMIEMATGEGAKACGRSSKAKLYSLRGTPYQTAKRAA